MMFQIKKLNQNAVVPTRANNSAGYDLYAIEDESLPPLSVTKIYLGFAAAFPPGYAGSIRDRSSMGQKGIHVFGGVIDTDYRGEWAVLLYNSKMVTQEIMKGDRIAQVLFHPSLLFIVNEVDKLEETNRGPDGFGSTGP